MCPICKKAHVHHDPKAEYHAIEIALEPITHHETWTKIPNGTVYFVKDDYSLEFSDLSVGSQRRNA